MKKTLLIIILLLSILLYSKPIKIASYNVQNLFDMRWDKSEYKEYIPNQHNWTKEMLEIKLNHISEVICDIEADIIGLQEVENAYVLDRLFDRLQIVGCGYKYRAITHTKGSAIQVAMLSQYPIKNQRDIEVGEGIRDILEVDLDIDGEVLTLFINHFKAKSRDGVESKRIKSAKALMSAIEMLPKDREYIILGDFNSDYDEYKHITTKLDDTNGTTAINDILQTKINTTLITKDDMQESKRAIHYTLWQELKPYQRWSYKFYGSKKTMDNILLDKSMFDGRGIDYINHSFGVYRASYLFTPKGYINSWKYKNSLHIGKGYSDHLPIYAYFDKKPYIGDSNPKTLIKNIEYLYTKEKLEYKIALKNIVVIKKIGESAIIKQTPNGRGIYLFGCAKELREGYIYDIVVDNIISYHGLKEITQIHITKMLKNKIDTSPYYLTKKDLNHLKQNEIITDIDGIYENGFLYINGNKIAIHFRKTKDKPKNHTRIKINYAHIGYYNGVNLIIQSKKNFEILE